MKKALLTTVFTGYNFGSSLQALASQIVLKDLGYDCHLVALKSIVKGRDIRLGKLLTILWRTFILRRDNGSKSLKTYQKSYSKEMIGDSMSRFSTFTDVYLKPQYMSHREMKRLAKGCDACFAGSDQIWNSSTMYVNPLYYLRFAPRNKRIAFAPSFGRDFIPDYNRKRIGVWVSDFSKLSVREDSGVRIIKELTGRDAVQLIDPTLMVNGETWKKYLGVKEMMQDYILAYFLDAPSEKAKLAISELKDYFMCDVVAIPYKFDDMEYCDRMVSSGPIEFVELVSNARCVLTDSFHGTAFSINLHIPFYVFGRNYGTAQSQNSRIESILKKMNMESRFEPEDVRGSINKIDFEFSDGVLSTERKKVRQYILSENS